MERKFIGADVPKTLHKKLQTLAKKEHRSSSAIIRMLVENYVEMRNAEEKAQKS